MVRARYGAAAALAGVIFLWGLGPRKVDDMNLIYLEKSAPWRDFSGAARAGGKAHADDDRRRISGAFAARPRA